MSDNHSQTNAAPFQLPFADCNEFAKFIDAIIRDGNIGAGLQVSGTSGGGKSNFAEWFAIRCLTLGLPLIFIDPHGDSAKKIITMLAKMPPSVRRSVLYVEMSSETQLVGINPLAHPNNEAELSAYMRKAHRQRSCELTASSLLAAVGEAGQGFGSRPTLRKWVMRWLTVLYEGKLTLADAMLFLDPHQPFYKLLLNLAPDELSREQMEALVTMKVADLEAEIGSARNRLLALLQHVAAEAILSRRSNVLNFEDIYHSGQSLIINLDCGETLTEEVQRMLANLILTQYLNVVISMPEHLRRRRFCMIDELPVFTEACGPLLDRMCRQIRKYKTSFVFMHQGASGFPKRQDDPLLLTLMDMCRVKIYFRHNVDAEFFGKQISLALDTTPAIKHLQIGEQQFSDGHDIMELIDRTEGTTETEGATTGEGNSSARSDSLAEVVQKVDADMSVEPTRTKSAGNALTTSESSSRHASSSRSSTIAHKQTLVARIITKKVVQGIQFYSLDEIDRHAAHLLKKQPTGGCIMLVDGASSPIECMTPKAETPFPNTPKYAKKLVRIWMEKMQKHPMFTTPEKMLAERSEFLDRLLIELQNIEMKRLECPADTPRLSTVSIRQVPEPSINKPPELGL
jgi:hypothetical protein